MKKIMFIQNEAHVLGGIYQVNKTLGLAFQDLGYDVQIVSIRNKDFEVYEENSFKQIIINKKEKWNFTYRRDVLNALKNRKKVFRTLNLYIKDYNKLRKDYKNLKQYILKEKPDYIIASHYQVLNGIPNGFLKNVIYVQHSTFNIMDSDRKNFKTLKKFNKKIFGISWLCKATALLAPKKGFIKNYYIYNPVRFKCSEKADVNENKKLIALTRFSEEKRIDLMVKIVNDVFKNKKFKDWKFELYGSGYLNEETIKIIEENNQIFNKGVVSNPMNVLLKSSIILNTSIMEGFPLSIIEAFTCGIPAVIFNFGEAACDQVLDGVDGFVVKQDDIDEYKRKLEQLMTDASLLEKFSKKAKNESSKFEVSNIVDCWLKLFEKMDDENDKS